MKQLNYNTMLENQKAAKLYHIFKLIKKQHNKIYIIKNELFAG